MSAAAQETPPLSPADPAAPRDWEWLWRFLALVMFLATAWVIWVALQMSPSTLATPAAFDAASRAAAHALEGRVSQAAPAAGDPAAEPRSAQETPLVALAAVPPGQPASGDGADSSGASSASSRPFSQELPYPPVDLNRLKRAETLSAATLAKLGKSSPPVTRE